MRISDWSSDVCYSDLNGFAFGGGFELALACDLIVASETARFGLPEPKVGVVEPAGGIQRSTQARGLKPAIGLLLTGATLGTGQAPGRERECQTVESMAVAEAIKKKKKGAKAPK